VVEPEVRAACGPGTAALTISVIAILIAIVIAWREFQRR
jgi:hypothetical protein